MNYFYDLIIIGSFFVVIEGIIGIPVIMYLIRKENKNQTHDLFRQLHSLGFDFNYETKKKIEESSDKNAKLLFECRLYIHDKFKQQLENISKLPENQLKSHITQLKEQYENQDKKSD